jgi:hypothetical protein
MALELDNKVVYLAGVCPMTCPKCGSRTQFETFPSGLEEHLCRHSACQFAFFVEREPVCSV